MSWSARLTHPDPLKLPPRIKVAAKRIADAAGTAIDAYAREVITDEPNITDRWIGAVAEALRKPPRGFGRGATGIMWEAKTLRSSSGRAAEERRHGADLLGVAEIHVGRHVVTKGFLGQAKRTRQQSMGRTSTTARIDVVTIPRIFCSRLLQTTGYSIYPRDIGCQSGPPRSVRLQ